MSIPQEVTLPSGADDSGVGPDGEGLCRHGWAPGGTKACLSAVSHDRVVWTDGGGMLVEYFCSVHAPADAEPIDWGED